MFLDVALAGALMVLALVINKMISSWHDESLKAFKKEEINLHKRLNSAISRQKKALVKLRTLRTQIKSYENMIDDDYFT